jgi:WD40 repeat protein
MLLRLPHLRVVGPGLPSADPARTAAAGYAAAPLLPVRDAGLSSVYTGNIPDSAVRVSSAISWRPDGAAVAIISTIGDQPVQLYDCRTGALLATLASNADNPPHPIAASPFTLDGDQLNPLTVLRWSADGTRLLLLNANLGTITVWIGTDLPSA